MTASLTITLAGGVALTSACAPSLAVETETDASTLSAAATSDAAGSGVTSSGSTGSGSTGSAATGTSWSTTSSSGGVDPIDCESVALCADCGVHTPGQHLFATFNGLPLADTLVTGSITLACTVLDTASMATTPGRVGATLALDCGVNPSLDHVELHWEVATPPALSEDLRAEYNNVWEPQPQALGWCSDLPSSLIGAQIIITSDIHDHSWGLVISTTAESSVLAALSHGRASLTSLNGTPFTGTAVEISCEPTACERSSCILQTGAPDWIGLALRTIFTTGGPYGTSTQTLVHAGDDDYLDWGAWNISGYQYTASLNSWMTTGALAPTLFRTVEPNATADPGTTLACALLARHSCGEPPVP